MESNGKHLISFFATRSDKGQELQRIFCRIAQEEFGVEVRVYSQATQVDLALACVNDDMVIFDATIEAPGLHNYPAATEQPKTLDHVYVVSRSYLPMNFFGVHQGGYPTFPNSKTNQELLHWLRGELANVLQAPPREKRKLYTWETLALDRNEFAEDSQKLFMESLERGEARRKAEEKIFISYRGGFAADVEALGRRIEDGEFHQGKKQRVKIIPTGELAFDRELLTAQRRWEILSTIDRIIVDAAEFWIYQTDNYLDSWWTRGELITQFYPRDGVQSVLNKWRIFNHATGRVSEQIPEKFRFQLNDRQIQRMSRWYANSDALTVGPEVVKRMRRMRTMIKFMPDGLLGNIYREAFANGAMGEVMDVVKKTIPDAPLEEVTAQYGDAKFLREYFADPVWDKEFWEYPLLQCKCPAVGQQQVDLEKFLWLKEPLHIEITPREMERAIKRGTLQCPKPADCPNRECNAAYRIEQRQARYLWLGTRRGKVSGGPNPGLQELPTYVAVSVE